MTMPKKPLSQLAAIGFVWEVFAAIALPAVVFALLGRALDNRYHLTPWMTLLGFVVAIAISGAVVYRMAKKFAQNMKSTP